MKTSVFAALLILTVVTFAQTPAMAADGPSAQTAVATVLPALTPAGETPVPVEPSCSSLDPAAALGLAIDEASSCPFGAPRCFKDDNCDSYCGDPRFGVCLNHCCACSG